MHGAEEQRGRRGRVRQVTWAAIALTGLLLTGCSTPASPVEVPTPPLHASDGTPAPVPAPTATPGPAPSTAAAPYGAEDARAALDAADPVDPAALASPGWREGTFVDFHSPSRNLKCGIYSWTEEEGTYADTGEAYSDPAGSLWGCAILEFDFALPERGTAEDYCPEEAHYTGGIEGTGLGMPKMACRTDMPFAYEDTTPVLQYGTSIRAQGVTCASEEDGIVCLTDQGHGFKLSTSKNWIF